MPGRELRRLLPAQAGLGQARAVREQVAQREAVAHLGVEVEQALLERDHAGRGDERLGQRGEREQRVRPDRLVAAALAHAGVALGEQAAGVHDDGGGPGTRPSATQPSIAASASSTRGHRSGMPQIPGRFARQ